jgi:hypothetical protein
MNQTGVQSTGSHRQAFRNRSFIRSGILEGGRRTCQFCVAGLMILNA